MTGNLVRASKGYEKNRSRPKWPNAKGQLLNAEV